jgi:dihydrofolate reductase
MAIIISAIFAMSENRVIGKDNSMPWHISEDLKHFKRTTLGKPIVMGRKQYESVGRALPGRTNIVISRDKNYKADDALVFSNIDEAVSMARGIAANDGLDEVFIVGGGEIYKQCLPITDRLYMTLIHRKYEGDVLFPELDMEEWKEISSEDFDGDPSYSIKILERKKVIIFDC